MLFGTADMGLSWRYYSLPRFVGAVGADLEFIQRGFSYGYAYSLVPDEKGNEQRQYYYYTRRLNSVMLPLVWQPHVYLMKNQKSCMIGRMVRASYIPQCVATWEKRK